MQQHSSSKWSRNAHKCEKRNESRHTITSNYVRNEEHEDNNSSVHYIVVDNGSGSGRCTLYSHWITCSIFSIELTTCHSVARDNIQFSHSRSGRFEFEGKSIEQQVALFIFFFFFLVWKVIKKMELNARGYKLLSAECTFYYCYYSFCSIHLPHNSGDQLNWIIYTRFNSHCNLRDCIKYSSRWRDDDVSTVTRTSNSLCSELCVVCTLVMSVYVHRYVFV